MRFARLLFVGLIFLVSACSMAATPTTNAASLEAATKLPVVALPGYEVSAFTQNDSRLLVSSPDAVAVDGQHVFIDYQNVTAKDCSDQGSSGSPASTVVEYNMKGDILNHWTIAGHSDGMRVDPATHLVWTTSCEDGNPMFAQHALAAGAVGYVLKEFADEELPSAVRAAARGEVYVSPRVERRLEALERSRTGEQLTAREVEVLRLLALGHTSVEIAARLQISARTVESHRARIHNKLGLTTRAELVRYALGRDLLVI